jgi:uncharacterized membrane protein
MARLDSARQQADTVGKQPKQGQSRWRLSRPQKVLAVFIAGYVLTFFLLAKRCYDCFGKTSHETSAANNILWWMIHGHPYRCSLFPGVSYLGIHAEFFWLALTPIYALVPRVYTLMFCQSLALGLTAVPVYLIVRRLWSNEVAGALMGMAFTFVPSIASGNLNQVHPVPYIPVFLLSAFYFFMERRLGLFALFAGLACLVRENVSLGVCMFGVWAWAEHRSWKWRLAPLLGGAAYFLFATKVVITWGLRGHPWHVTNYFSYLGHTPDEILHNALSQPGLVLAHLMEAENLQYLVLLVQPMGWVLPFGHWAALVAAPDLAGNLISDNGGAKVLAWHYQFMACTGLFMGATFTTKRILDRLHKRFGGDSSPIVAGGFLALCLAHWIIWFQPQEFRPLPYHDALEQALAMVPPDKSVLAPFRLQGNVSAREHFDKLVRFTEAPEYAAQFEYVILDANDRQYPPPITQEFFDSFSRNPKYRLLFSAKNVFVFQRLGGEPDWKIQTVEPKPKPAEMTGE